MKRNLFTVYSLRFIVFGLLYTLAQITSAQERIILLNEGIWQADNGRMTYFEDDHVVSNQWFRDQNGYKIGDTPNDIIQINDNLIAIAINWSNIVQFITPDGKAVAATEDIPNNRKLCTDGKYVYVTSYGHECVTTDGVKQFNKGYVAKIDVSTFKVVAATEVGYEPEGIALYKGHLFVANTGGYAFEENHEYETTVSILNAETMEVVKTVDTHQINLFGKMSQSGRYLCINSSGDNYEVPAASIIFDCEKALQDETDCYVRLDYAATYNCTMLDGRFLAIGSRFSFYTSEYTFDYIIIDPAEVMHSQGASGSTPIQIGSIMDDIQKMDTPYGIYVNPYTGYIYATDAGSFAAAGQLYQWSPEGQLLGKHKVYINPGHFLALPPNGQHFNGHVTTDSVQSPYINKVYEYRPAPGQFVNILPKYEEGDTWEDMAHKAQENLTNDEVVSLGGYGGYIIFGFDHMVENHEGKMDFHILGNASYSNTSNPDASRKGGSCESGVVMVSYDANGNGVPDDEWYELAGSEYGSTATIHNYRITYYRPDETKERTPGNSFLNDTTYIRWTDNQGQQGYVSRNTFHNQPYYPQWLHEDEMVFEGTRLADNYVDESGKGTNYVLYAYPWGYADNHSNQDDLSKMNIDWAVDSNGQRVHLPGIHFVKVYTALNQSCGWLGETSTEIQGASDLHLLGIDIDDIWSSEESAIEKIENGKSSNRMDVYDLNGRVVDIQSAPAGIYIERRTNGVRKVLKR